MIELSGSYYVAVGLFSLLLIQAAANAMRPWALPLGIVVVTVGAWYLFEPLYFPELFFQFRSDDEELAFASVSIFYVALLVLAPGISSRLQPRAADTILSKQSITADRLVVIVALTWLTLLAFGTYRMEGDLIEALFPVNSRAGARMWSRAAASGSGAGGFIISMASYVYVLCLASFGVLLFFARNKSTKVFLILLILLSWPYSFFQGSRNILLATVVPAGIAFLMFGRVSRLVKFVVTIGGLAALEFAMRLIIVFRNQGFGDMDLSQIEDKSHLGLNMASELVFITSFLEDGKLSLTYGIGYLAELANVIPRAIWPNKPLIGIDYAIARGFGDSGGSDIGVFATVSSGLIGQGVLNFGNIFGPIVVAVLMAYWIGFLARLKAQGTPLRLGLFLIGTGMTFNLGRDLTLLTLWPFVFGYVGVRILEQRELLRIRRLSAVSHRPVSFKATDRNARDS